MTATPFRTRWAAIGAAIAISLGAGGAGLLQATSPSGASAFVPITPCRLFDTRPESQVGDRGAPMGANDTFVVGSHGDQGNCDGAAALPSTARGLVLNVTAVGASAATFLTFWPAGEDRPTASSLNPAPGQPPTPNAVTVDLGVDGEFAVYNRFGQVHLVADVVGYYTDHHHDDRYFTKQQTTDLIGARDPILVEGEAPEYETTTIYADPNGLQLRMWCGLSSGTVYLEVGAGSGAPVWGQGTMYDPGPSSPAYGWSPPLSGGTLFLGRSGPTDLTGTVIVDDADAAAWAISATIDKSAGCPYRIHLTPLGAAS